MSQPKKRRGLVFWGCSGALVLVLIAVGGAAWFWFDLVEMFETHTETTPREVRVIEPDPAVAASVEQRAMRSWEEKGAISLTGEEINQLIATRAEEARGAAWVRVEENSLFVDLSVPIHEKGEPTRYFNGNVELDVAIESGELKIEILGAESEAAGEIPERGVLYAQKAIEGSSDEIKKKLREVFGEHAENAKSIEIRDGRLIFSK